MANNEYLRKALAEQEHLLEELNAQLTELVPLQQQRDNVHTLVSQMRFNLGLGPYISPEKAASSRVEAVGPEGPAVRITRPIWAVAKTVIEQAGRPLSPAELTETLFGLGFKTLLGRPGRETVRALLNKKKKIFEKVEGGKFALRADT